MNKLHIELAKEGGIPNEKYCFKTVLSHILRIPEGRYVELPWKKLYLLAESPMILTSFLNKKKTNVKKIVEAFKEDDITAEEGWLYLEFCL